VNAQHILILGGYGSTGLPIARYLLSQTHVLITLAGRNLEKANNAAAILNAECGRKFGRQYCIPMFLEEMRSLPEAYPTLRETGFFVGGFNWFVDWFLSPIIMIGVRLFPKTGLRPLGRLMFWGLNTFSHPPFGTILKLEARGTKKNVTSLVEVLISHEDGYALTAIPVVACLMQCLDGSIRKPGLWLQACIVEPQRFFVDMEKMGAQVQVVTKQMEN
jgi:saccharopine dehydrogenase (NAD+, L-lysine-forming)